MAYGDGLALWRFVNKFLTFNVQVIVLAVLLVVGALLKCNKIMKRVLLKSIPSIVGNFRITMQGEQNCCAATNGIRSLFVVC